MKSLCNKAFSQRRKMLKNCLKDFIELPEKVLEEIGLDVKVRAEELTVQDFEKLTLYMN